MPRCPSSPGSVAALRVVLGQVISMTMAASGFTNSVLGEKGMNVPIGQGILFYGMLSVFLIPYFVMNGRKKPAMALWKYFVIGFLDVQGNAMSAYAYQNGSLTVVSLLSLLSLPSSMLMSVALKMAKYRVRHYIFMVLALLGIIACVLYESLTPSDNGGEEEEALNATLFESVGKAISNATSSIFLKSSNEVLGIIFGALAPIDFGVLNALGEYFVTNCGVIEYVGFFGVFGAIVCGVETAIFEWSKWSVPAPGMWILTEFLIAIGYVIVPLYLKYTPVTILNMSLLTIGAYGMIMDCVILGADFNWPDLVCEIWSIIFTALFAWAPPARAENENNRKIADDVEEDNENEPLISSYSSTESLSETPSLSESRSEHTSDTLLYEASEGEASGKN